ncbi:Na+/H+ antiporter NhaA [Coxiella endosymbiont of Amblyomma americanum]|uniref:Na+/H+ antiporter NhaA n=1 Tax=Coxiella endosymbiont of Amblyomma americanum TaxID=325775 RepID=UPI000581EF3F|nr:Na+/H+ antiporter NhaA [Coxiella endosymbiont of Amblyomma americanum]AJC50232.1 sodium/proton antiporter, NhaA family [Coxiella endosymbiont of Amblyomma americanum]
MKYQILHKSPKIVSKGSIILFISAVLALILDNTSWCVYYETLFNSPLSVQLGALQLSRSLLFWINSGLMTVYFLLIGLEIKREILYGKLKSFSKVFLPVIAGLGGILVPIIIYIAFNWKNTLSLRGWAIPTATDIAFSLGMLSLAGNRLPINLKIFLTTLAVFDDIGSIFIIAIFYTHHFSLIFLLSAGCFLGLLILLNRLHVTMTTIYILVGIILWICVLESGIHATLVGIIVAFTIPVCNRKDRQVSSLHNLERVLQPWVTFGVLPIFAFANSGISLTRIGLESLFSPITLGIALGLFLGKQIGICLAYSLGIKAFSWIQPISLFHKKDNIDWRFLYGTSVIAGMGFTMSLLISTIAFGDIGQSYSSMARLGVIIGSSLSGIFGYLILSLSSYREYSSFKKLES